MLQSSPYHLSDIDLTKEEGLITAAKNDINQFGKLYDKYYEQIFRFIYQRLDDKDAASDATQQVFLKAMTSLYKFEYRGVPFSAWLYRIALSELNNVFRSEKALRCVNIESEHVYQLVSELEETKVELYHDRIVGIIADKLDDDDLHLIEMRFFEKRSFKEIGEIMEISENNAKVRTYRILDKLKKHLK